MVTFRHDDAGTPEASWLDGGVTHLPVLPDEAVPGHGDGLLVVAAHPDDESLGAAGLIRHVLRAGARVRVLLCTAGEGSHPDSPTSTPEALGELRTREFDRAMRALDPDAARGDGPSPAGGRSAGTGSLVWRLLGLPDGALQDHGPRLDREIAAEMAALRTADGAGSAAPGRLVIASTYRHDGHGDHEAVGAAAARAATEHGLGLLEFPIWYWHWASPEDGRWRGWHQLPLGADGRASKRRAMDSHHSQVHPLSGQPGDEVLLTPAMLEHFDRPSETYRWTPSDYRGAGTATSDFDSLYHRDPDPWAYLSSWYEQRKRAVTLASLPRPRYGHAVEAGSSIGVLTAMLAERCDELDALDASGRAIELARQRLEHLGHVRLRHAVLPAAWSFANGSLDLVVVSEIGYFLAADELDDLLRRAWSALRPGGHLLLCHWLGPIVGWPLDGEEVHRAARAVAGEPLVEHREEKFLLEVFEQAGPAA